MMTRYAQLIQRHYENVWGVPASPATFVRGPIGALPPDFAVLEFSPKEHRKMWTYATRCMSRAEDTRPIEIHFFSSTKREEAVERLYAIAHYHRTGTKLGLGHSVNLGTPWVQGSRCDHGLISLPYLDGPKLEWLVIGSRRVRFLWLIPVTADEVAFKKRFGLEALEREFDEKGLDYLDLSRNSVC